MLAFLFSNLLDPQYWVSYPWLAILSVFQLWMLIDAVRRREWVWALFITIGWGVSASVYYFMGYRAAPSATRGFELPGAHWRRPIQPVQAQNHHPAHGHYHSPPCHSYLQQRKL